MPLPAHAMPQHLSIDVGQYRPSDDAADDAVDDAVALAACST